MKIGILNSGGYNFNSIVFALNRLNITDICLVKNEEQFNTCDKIIIPGVGHAATAMNLISTQHLTNCIKNTKKPVLGICLGMQIMFNSSQEGNVKCLEIFDGEIIKLPQSVRTPQMGWNKLITGRYNNQHVYFANSYYSPVGNYTTSYVSYDGVDISAIVEKNNFLGCQFHPEKSGIIGEKILQNFILLY